MATTTQFNKYGVNTTLSIKKSAASKHKQRLGLAYPLVEVLGDTVTGGFIQQNKEQSNYFSKSQGLSLIRNNLRQLLLCEKGERVMLPDYGLNLNRFLFEPLDKTTFQLIKNDIVKTIEKYFSIAKIISLQVMSEDIDIGRSQLVVSLTLQLVDESLNLFDIEVRVG